MAIPDLQEAIELIESGKAEEAISPLTAWAQQMPAHAAVHAVLARAYEAVEQWDEAQAAWQRMRFLMPNSPAVREGLARVHAATAERVPAGEDRLIMDLDLQAELEATLEALFNPFTLPQQSEVALEEEPTTEEPTVEESTALAQVEAALAAAETDAAEEEAIEGIETTEETETTEEVEALEETEPAEEIETAEEVEAAEGIETAEEVEAAEEIDAAAALEAPEVEAPPQETEPAEAAAEDEHTDGAKSIYEEIEQLIEEKTQQKTTAEAPEDHLLENVAEQQQAQPPDLADLLAEEQEAIKALETMGEQTTGEEAGGLENWGDFETEPEAAPPSNDATIEDLDRLISELEAARIVPQPDLDDIPAPELEDEIDDVVSETLARIYASQKKYHEATRIYEQLAHQQPEEATKFLQLAAEMRGLTEDASDEASPGEQG